MAVLTREVLATTSATIVTRTAGSWAFELYNRGPNSIWVALDDSSTCVANKCREVKSGEVWAVETSRPPFILCAVAQSTGAATVITEVN